MVVISSLPNLFLLQHLPVMSAPLNLFERLPDGLAEPIWDWFRQNRVQLTITKRRGSKLGDFRSATRNLPHRISVNGDLNKYLFLFVLLHEMAHLIASQRFGKKAKPHGLEWKAIFKELFFTMVPKNSLPESIEAILPVYFDKHTSNSQANEILIRTVQTFSNNSGLYALLETLPEGTWFMTTIGKHFLKQGLRRKRFLCKCASTGRLYLFNPLASVIPVPVEFTR